VGGARARGVGDQKIGLRSENKVLRHVRASLKAVDLQRFGLICECAREGQGEGSCDSKLRYEGTRSVSAEMSGRAHAADWLRESLPHRSMLQEQTAQMRADFEREISSLKDELAAARSAAEAERTRLESKLAALREDKEREERVLRDALRVLEREAAKWRADLEEASAAAAKLPGLQERLERARHDNAALKIFEEQHGAMSSELDDLRQRLPAAEATASRAARERDEAVAERRKSDEAQRSLVRSLELTQQQHEQLEATARREKKEAESRQAEVRGMLEGQMASLRRDLEAAKDATARKQQLLEETRRRAEEDAEESERALEQLRQATANEQRQKEVEHAKVCKKMEATVADLQGKGKELERALAESQQRQEDLRRELDQTLIRAVRHRAASPFGVRV